MQRSRSHIAHIPRHLWFTLGAQAIFLLILACMLSGSIAYVASTYIQRSGLSLQTANVISLVAASLLVGIFQGVVSQSLLSKPINMSGRRAVIWIGGTLIVTALSTFSSIGIFLTRANVPIFNWAFENIGFALLMLLPAVCVGLVQGAMLRNGWRGMLAWMALVLASWMMAAKLCEGLFFMLWVRG